MQIKSNCPQRVGIAPSWTILLILSLCAGFFVSGFLGCSTFRNDRSAQFAYERTQNGDQSDSAYKRVSYEEDAYDDGISLEDLSPTNITNSVKSIAGYGPDQELAEDYFIRAKQQYDEAVREYEFAEDSEQARADFLEAGDRFFSAGKRWPDSRLEQDALYYAGDAYFFAEHYAKANQAFELLVSKYPGTRYLDLAQSRRFAVAQYWLELNRASPDNLLTYHLQDRRRPTRDTKGNAIRIFNRIRLDDPTGRLADDATMELANAYFADERFIDAADTYEDLRIAFPTSKHQYDAHVLELKARLEAYQGSSYDGTHLKKADKLLSAVMKQFPTEVDKEREQLTKLAAEIRFRLAEREMKMARYYDYSGQYRSATIYYQEVIDNYPTTPQAQEAQERVMAIADKPAKPPQRAQWLVNFFPQADETKPLIATSPTREALK